MQRDYALTQRDYALTQRDYALTQRDYAAKHYYGIEPATGACRWSAAAGTALRPTLDWRALQGRGATAMGRRSVAMW